MKEIDGGRSGKCGGSDEEFGLSITTTPTRAKSIHVGGPGSISSVAKDRGAWPADHGNIAPFGGASGRRVCQAGQAGAEGATVEQPAYECPNSKCKSTRLVPIGRDPKNKNGRGEQQVIYQCEDCRWKVGEISLERRRLAK